MVRITTYHNTFEWYRGRAESNLHQGILFKALIPHSGERCAPCWTALNISGLNTCCGKKKTPVGSKHHENTMISEHMHNDHQTPSVACLILAGNLGICWECLVLSFSQTGCPRGNGIRSTVFQIRSVSIHKFEWQKVVPPFPCNTSGPFPLPHLERKVSWAGFLKSMLQRAGIGAKVGRKLCSCKREQTIRCYKMLHALCQINLSFTQLFTRLAQPWQGRLARLACLFVVYCCLSAAARPMSACRGRFASLSWQRSWPRDNFADASDERRRPRATCPVTDHLRYWGHTSFVSCWLRATGHATLSISVMLQYSDSVKEKTWSDSHIWFQTALADFGHVQIVGIQQNQRDVLSPG